MSRKIMIPVLIATVVLVGAMAFAGPEGSVRGGNRDRVPVLAAKDFNLAALEGRVVLVGFWRAVDCPSCEAYISWLTRMQAEFLDDGLVVVAVNEDVDSASGTDLLNKIHRRSQVVLDPTGRMGASYQLKGMPSTYLYDRNLNMSAKFVGFVAEETDSLVAAIAELVEKPYEE
jgi:thiol-disulfide isomerase/thioredoxin